MVGPALELEAIYNFAPSLGLSLYVIKVMEKLVIHHTHTGIPNLRYALNKRINILFACMYACLS